MHVRAEELQTLVHRTQDILQNIEGDEDLLETATRTKAAIQTVVSQRDEAILQRDKLVHVLVRLFGWSDTSYLHAIEHVREATQRMREDLASARRAQENLLKVIEAAEACGWDGINNPKSLPSFVRNVVSERDVLTRKLEGIRVAITETCEPPTVEVLNAMCEMPMLGSSSMRRIWSHGYAALASKVIIAESINEPVEE